MSTTRIPPRPWYPQSVVNRNDDDDDEDETPDPVGHTGQRHRNWDATEDPLGCTTHDEPDRYNRAGTEPGTHGVPDSDRRRRDRDWEDGRADGGPDATDGRLH